MSAGPEDESAASPGKVPLTARLLLADSLTARRAAGIIAAYTVLVTVVGGILERVLDHQEYPTIGKGLWLALQTVTTVGYGDVTPQRSVGRFIAVRRSQSGRRWAVLTARLPHLSTRSRLPAIIPDLFDPQPPGQDDLSPDTARTLTAKNRSRRVLSPLRS